MSLDTYLVPNVKDTHGSDGALMLGGERMSALTSNDQDHCTHNDFAFVLARV